MGSEKRYHPRIPTDFELTIQHAGTFHWSSLRNLSQGGVFVQTDMLQDVGSIVSLQLKLPVDAEIMDIQGRVKWILPASSTDPSGMGIEFTSISPEHQQKINGFIGNILAVLGKSS